MIDRDQSRLDQAREQSGATVVLGDATEPSLLERSGIRAADVVVAVTGHDEDNLVVASLAKFEFEVPHVVARVKNALNAWLYEPDMGVDVLVSAPHTIAAADRGAGHRRRRRPAARARPRPGRADRGHAPRGLAGRRPGGRRDRVAAGLRRGGGDPRHARAPGAGRPRARGRRPPAVRHRRGADGAAAPAARNDAPAPSIGTAAPFEAAGPRESATLASLSPYSGVWRAVGRPASGLPRTRLGVSRSGPRVRPRRSRGRGVERLEDG